ncbi:antibiotic biosynthesis monooxygenase family protein [Aureitalea marina]|uniref:Antibiotic biosynthesis monooxygenase n=1 Tax=Aureitalea marina TaxID=930804 RepID=A0A2S7KRT4_9FLAO|nr:antibiotic biosynthesis monooxygenase [Aureitalea marina]PQB05345.1 antibiotic biosynthesis monooxygenase [Aureitalea marina]
MTPYYAVIFSNTQTDDLQGYAEMASAMEELASQQAGYLGMEHAREEIGITISYWETLEDIRNWKANLDHQLAQDMGKEKWYSWYKTRICKVEREYEFHKS